MSQSSNRIEMREEMHMHMLRKPSSAHITLSPGSGKLKAKGRCLRIRTRAVPEVRRCEHGEGVCEKRAACESGPRSFRHPPSSRTMSLFWSAVSRSRSQETARKTCAANRVNRVPQCTSGVNQV